ncbi:MAG: hypothetical protein ACRDRI_24105 [Pseudonocardiaceae bacterium]
MSEHPPTVPGARKAHPVGGAPRWGVSSTDHTRHDLVEMVTEAPVTEATPEDTP